MKIIVIGLGHFGTALSVRLTDMGHEVIGVDSALDRVDALKNRLSTTICLDAGNPDVISVLPIKDVDLVIVAIGVNFAASIQAVASLKQSGAKRILARATSALHLGVLQTLGVERVISVAKDAAEILAQSLSLSDFISSYRVDADHYVVQFTAPSAIVGKSIAESDIESRFGLQVITIKRYRNVKNLLGLVHSERAVTGIPTPDTVVQDGDIVVVYGRLRDYDDFVRSLPK